MAKLTVIIDEHGISREKALFIKNYTDFLNVWEDIVNALWEKEERIVISHPIVSKYFMHLKSTLGEKIKIIDNNPRHQLAVSLGLNADDLDFLSYREILDNRLLEKVSQRPLTKEEEPYLWLLEQITQKNFTKTKPLNYLVNYLAYSGHYPPVEKIVLKLIYEKELAKYSVIQWLKKGNIVEKSQALLSYLALKNVLTKEEIEVYLFQDLTENAYEIERLPEEELENIYPLFSLDEILNKHISLKKYLQRKLKELLEQGGLDKFLELVSGKLALEKAVLENWIKAQEFNFTNQDLTAFQEQTIRNKFGNDFFMSLLNLIPPPKPKPLNLDYSIKKVLDWVENEYFPFFSYSRKNGQYQITEIYAQQFEEWFLKHYEEIINSEFSILNPFYTFKKQIGKTEKTLYLIIDGLGYWFLQEYFPSNLKINFFKKCFCFVPSITAINKPSLLSGKLPSETRNDYNKLGQQLEALVSNDARETITAFAQKEFKCGIYFVNSFDDILHKSYAYNILKQELQAKLMYIFEEIAQLKDMDIIITADHGFTILPEKKKNLLKLGELEGEVSHCRVVKLNRDVEIDGQSWIKINRYLSENYCIARGYKYIENFPKGATHGGVTPEEIIVPFILITPSFENFIPLDIKIQGEIWKQKMNLVNVLIENPNKDSVIVEDLYIEFVKLLGRSIVLKEGTNVVSANFDARKIKDSAKQIKIYYKVKYGGKVHEREGTLGIKLKALMQTGWEDLLDE